MFIRVPLQHVRRQLVILIPTYRPSCKDIKPRREDDGKDERSAVPSRLEHQRDDGQKNTQKRRHDSRKLRALAKGSSNEEGPACEGESEEEVDDEDESRIGGREDAETPC